MKRSIKIVTILIAIAGVIGGSLYYMGFPYKSPRYMATVMVNNQELVNYEREISLSLAVNGEKKHLSSLEKVDGSFLVLNEKREEDKYLLTYNLTSQQEAFQGEFYQDEEDFIVKSPMYHRYILFDKDTETKESDYASLQHTLGSFFLLSLSDMKIKRDIGANEVGVKTLSIPVSNESTSFLLKCVVESMEEGIPYQGILYQNKKITNKLLNQNKTIKEVELKFHEDRERLINDFSQVLDKSTVVDSKISFKLTKNEIINEISVVLEFLYEVEESGIRVPFTVYLDVNTWGVNKTEVTEPMTDPTNSLPYDMMTGEMEYLKNENMKIESQPEEDSVPTFDGVKEQTEQGIYKDSMTLEELGSDFIPVLPEDKEETTNKNKE